MSARTWTILANICKNMSPLQWANGMPILWAASKKPSNREYLRHIAAVGYGKICENDHTTSWRCSKLRHIRELRRMMTSDWRFKQATTAPKWQHDVDTYLTLTEQRHGVRSPLHNGRKIIPPGTRDETKRDLQRAYDQACIDDGNQLPPAPCFVSVTTDDSTALENIK